MAQEYSILIADSDLSEIKIIRELIAKNFPDMGVLIADDSESAWNMVKLHKPDLVLLGLMSSGLNSMQFARLIRDSSSLFETYVIVISSNMDTNIRLKMLADANDIMTKPVNVQDFIMKVKTAEHYIRLKKRFDEEDKLLLDLADELENEIKDITQLSVKFLQTRVPVPTDTLKRISNASVWLATQLGEKESENLRDVEIAGFLCYTGKLFLPDYLIKSPVMLNGRVSNSLMYQVPVSAKDIISTVRRFKDAANILYHLYENFDGSGFPDRLQSWQIPVGSRIIRVALDYEEMRIHNGYTSREAINYLRREEKRLYDYKVITLFEQYIAIHTKDEPDITENIVLLQDLAEGMLVTRDIMTVSGMKLIPAGAILRQGTIEKLISHNSSDPILGSIIVRS